MLLNTSQMNICTQYENNNYIELDMDKTLTVSAIPFLSYLDIDIGFGAPYTGNATFRVVGQVAITIRVTNDTISLAELFPKLVNVAARGIPRSAIYSRNANDLIYLCWQTLLNNKNAPNAEQVIYCHDLISNHVGLRCSHLGEDPDTNCEQCYAR